MKHLLGLEGMTAGERLRLERRHLGVVLAVEFGVDLGEPPLGQLGVHGQAGFPLGRGKRAKHVRLGVSRRPLGQGLFRREGDRLIPIVEQQTGRIVTAEKYGSIYAIYPIPKTPFWNTDRGLFRLEGDKLVPVHFRDEISIAPVPDGMGCHSVFPAKAWYATLKAASSLLARQKPQVL